MSDRVNIKAFYICAHMFVHAIIKSTIKSVYFVPISGNY